jgi:hypothetical protein
LWRIKVGWLERRRRGKKQIEARVFWSRRGIKRRKQVWWWVEASMLSACSCTEKTTSNRVGKHACREDGPELGCSLRMIFRISRNKKIDRYSDTIRREIEENIFTTIFKNLFLIYNNFKVCK